MSYPGHHCGKHWERMCKHTQCLILKNSIKIYVLEYIGVANHITLSIQHLFEQIKCILVEIQKYSFHKVYYYSPCYTPIVLIYQKSVTIHLWKRKLFWTIIIIGKIKSKTNNDLLFFCLFWARKKIIFNTRFLYYKND